MKKIHGGIPSFFSKLTCPSNDAVHPAPANYSGYSYRCAVEVLTMRMRHIPIHPDRQREKVCCQVLWIFMRHTGFQTLPHHSILLLADKQANRVVQYDDCTATSALRGLLSNRLGPVLAVAYIISHYVSSPTKRTIIRSVADKPSAQYIPTQKLDQSGTPVSEDCLTTMHFRRAVIQRLHYAMEKAGHKETVAQ